MGNIIIDDNLTQGVELIDKENEINIIYSSGVEKIQSILSNVQISNLFKLSLIERELININREKDLLFCSPIVKYIS